MANVVDMLKAVRCGIAGLATLCAVAAQGQTPPAQLDLKQQHDLLFAASIRDPANVDVSFRYAEVATKVGDFEAAIGALERIIFYNPNLPRVRLELGVLYFRLGSYEMSRSYFESAVGAADAPPEVRARVASFLAEIDRRLQTTQFTFNAQAGFRYQSNANAGPNSSLVKALGLNATLADEFARRSDWNAFAAATARYVYDFGNQRGDVLEAMATMYYARQFKIDRLNTGAVEASVGPRLALAPDALPGWSVKGYAIGAFAALADKPFFASPGVGVTVAIPTDWALIEPGYEFRRRSFRNSTEYPTARDQRGQSHVVYVNASGVITQDWRWMARLARTRINAEVDSSSMIGTSFDFGLLYDFDAPISSVRKWTANVFFGVSRNNYDQPNPIVDPTTRRRDREWRIGAGLDAPIWQNAGLSVVVLYNNVNSSLPNYRMRNLSVSFGPTIRF